MSEKYHYESGAIHNDNHKELNIGSVSESTLSNLISQFLKDDAMEAEIVEEVKKDEEVNNNVIGRNLIGSESADVDNYISSISKCFRFNNDFVKNIVETVVKGFYSGSHTELALIEVTLYDHGQLKKRNAHTDFVKSLIAWRILDVKDKEDLKKIADGISDKFNRLPKEGYKSWDEYNLNDKNMCIAIGKKLDDSMKYCR